MLVCITGEEFQNTDGLCKYTVTAGLLPQEVSPQFLYSDVQGHSVLNIFEAQIAQVQN